MKFQVVWRFWLHRHECTDPATVPS